MAITTLGQAAPQVGSLDPVAAASPYTQQQAVTNPTQGISNMVSALVAGQADYRRRQQQQALQAASQGQWPGQPQGQPLNIAPNSNPYGSMGAALFTQPPGGPAGFGSGSSGGALY